MKHCMLLAMLLSVPALAADFHVAPTGADANPGSADKPLATLSKALELTRKVQNEPNRILLHSGRYYDVSVTLTAADSNLTIEPAPGHTPILHGGVPLKNWQNEPNFAVATLPPGRNWDIRMLQVDGQYRPRARYPRDGTLTHLSSFDVPWMSTTYGGWKRKPTPEELTTLKYKPGDLPEDIANAEVTVFHMWDESVAAIASHDPQTHTLKLSPELGHPPGAFGVKKYCLWNLPAGLTSPGQWYFDRARARIVYWPLPGQDMRAADALVPTQTSIFKITGARNLTLRNLTLSVTTVPLMTGGFAAGRYPAAIELDKTENCTLDGLSIANVAGHAIKARRNIINTRIENCTISHCGAGGIYAGGDNARIHNNLIHAIGLAYPSAIGINGGGKNCTVSHNTIHDTPYSALDFGGENHLIEANRIYDCMKVLHDGGAIYIFSGKNVTLRGNYAHDIPDTGGYGSSAYYLDEQCENCTVEKNLSVNVARPSHNHMARNNTIRDNVFVTAGDLRITFPRCSGYTFSNNVLYAPGKITLDGANAVATWSNNLFHSGVGKIETTVMNDYSATGRSDAPPPGTTLADPQFVDPAARDFRYKPASPAHGMNLRRIDPSAAGKIK